MEKNKIYAFLAIDQFKKILMYPEFQHTSIYPIEDLKTLLKNELGRVGLGNGSFLVFILSTAHDKPELLTLQD